MVPKPSFQQLYSFLNNHNARNLAKNNYSLFKIIAKVQVFIFKSQIKISVKWLATLTDIFSKSPSIISGICCYNGPQSPYLHILCHWQPLSILLPWEQKISPTQITIKHNLFRAKKKWRMLLSTESPVTISTKHVLQEVQVYLSRWQAF